MPAPATHGDMAVVPGCGGDTSYLTFFSVDGEHRLNTPSEATQSLSKRLRGDFNGGALVKPYRRSSWLFFQFSCSQVALHQKSILNQKQVF
jgi:hypothetical protein